MFDLTPSLLIAAVTGTTTTGTATTGTSATTLSFSHVLLLLGIVVVGMLLAGVLVAVARAKVTGSSDSDPGSVVRSWIAISLVMGLLVFCATAFLIDDPSLRSTLYGGLIASVGAAVAFYFSSKGADQARSDILNTVLTLSQGGTPPTGFSAMTPQAAVSGTPYTYTFVANGQPAPRISAVSGSTLPPGLTLAVDGTLEGTPSAAGTYTFSLRAANQAGSVVSPTISMTVS